ncbi:universal stress protein [Stenotrophomonas sp. YIM B06876]|uniref:universal stress protein n=1 Tax=Stenotrophomonas sp. YIM B06876 TaxID=3060211 RepID=UPI002738C0A3|nr:universal stress protein [Stenotrophomonas sp. YIM B06876]
MYKRILIATDGSDLSARGLDKGLELAAQLGAAVDIVTVSEPWAVGMYDAMGWSVGYETSPEYKKDREDAAQKILQPAVDVARASGIANVVSHHVLDRYAADGIIETAETCGCDLIVMTSHGRRGVTRVLLGSQTTEVLVRTKLPVLVIR